MGGSLGQGLQTMGNNITSAFNDANSTLNQLHNNQNNNLNPSNWGNNAKDSSFFTGAGTPWGAEGQKSSPASAPGISWAGTPFVNNPAPPSNPPASAPAQNTPLPQQAFNYSTPQRSNANEDALRASYMSSLNPNYGFTFQGQTAPQGAFNTLSIGAKK